MNTVPFPTRKGVKEHILSARNIYGGKIRISTKLWLWSIISAREVVERREMDSRRRGKYKNLEGLLDAQLRKFEIEER